MGPIEPAALTAATLLATKALEALGGKAGEQTWAGMGRLVALVRRKVTGHEPGETALTEVQRHPDDQNRIRVLAELLAAFAAQDAAFHRELAALVTDARRDPTIGPLTAQVYGQAQVGQLLNISKVRDIYVQSSAVAPSVSAEPPQPPGVRWPAPGRTISNLAPRNLLFTGREDLLAALRERLMASTTAAVIQPQALHGLGGVGKTQLALEYAHRRSSDYDVVWWVTADQPAAIAGQLVALARRLEIREAEAADQAESVQALWDALRGRDRWLLIFDNAEEPSDLRSYWPTGGGGHVLITSRNPAWGGFATAVTVEILPRAEAIAFFKRRIELDHQAADELAEALGDLPLALEQAAAYLEETGTPADEYLALLRDRAPDLFNLGRPARTEQTIATTWAVSLERIRTNVPVAQDLLCLCSFLAPDDLPRALVTQHPDELPDSLASAVRDQVGFQQAVGALRRYSLITATGDAISTHRLVQAVVRHSLGRDVRPQWAATAVRLVAAAFPDWAEDVRRWPAATRLLPHALAAIEHAESVEADPTGRATLMHKSGRYLWGRAEYAQAKALHERAMALRKIHLGTDHPDVASSFNNLALVRLSEGDLDGARIFYERALRIREAHLGHHHRATAASLTDLAAVLRDQGDFDGARTLHERALRIREAHLGADHPTTATSLGNLGDVLHDQGDLAGARSFFERALAIREARLGPDHPTTAASLTDLAAVLRDQGDLAGARNLQERALAIYETRLGLHHPTTAQGLHNLAAILADKGDLAHARGLYERALAIVEARLGPDHPDTARSRQSLAVVVAKLGERPESGGQL